MQQENMLTQKDTLMPIWMSVCVFEEKVFPNTKPFRLEKEKFWIKTLQCKIPPGLNVLNLHNLGQKITLFTHLTKLLKSSYKFFKGWPSQGEHLFAHLLVLWSIFQTSLHILQITIFFYICYQLSYPGLDISYKNWFPHVHNSIMLIICIMYPLLTIPPLSPPFSWFSSRQHLH